MDLEEEIEPDIEELEFEDEVQPLGIGEERKRESYERITSPVLGKYTAAKLIGYRARQLEKGAQSVIPRNQLTSTEPQKIARQELNQRVIPLKVIRHLPDNTFEEWKITDFRFNHF